MNALRTRTSFRDPSSRTVVSANRVFRAFNDEGWRITQRVLETESVRRRQDAGDIIGCRAVDETTVAEEGIGELRGREWAAIVEHSRVAFPTFPYEWPAEMLHAAGRLTLDLAEDFLDAGIGLKDATPYNVLFLGTRPVFVDLSSFELRDPGDPIWRAEGQFIRTFLLPLLAAKAFGLSIDRLMLTRREGLMPGELHAMAGGLQSLSRNFFNLVTLPVMLARRHRRPSPDIYRPRRWDDPERARFVLRRRLRKLGHRLERLSPAGVQSNWTEYMDDLPYTETEFADKEEFVRTCLSRHQPKRVLDIGCNTGNFSLLAAEFGASVVAVDSDSAVVGETWRRASAEGRNVLPLVQNLAWPSPPTGWNNAENPSFLERAAGQFDAVFMMALLHHLMARENVPLDKILDIAADLTVGCAIVEYISPDDANFRLISRGRDALFNNLNEASFEAACRARFEISASRPLAGGTRRIYELVVRRSK